MDKSEQHVVLLINNAHIEETWYTNYLEEYVESVLIALSISDLVASLNMLTELDRYVMYANPIRLENLNPSQPFLLPLVP